MRTQLTLQQATAEAALLDLFVLNLNDCCGCQLEQAALTYPYPYPYTHTHTYPYHYPYTYTFTYTYTHT